MATCFVTRKNFKTEQGRKFVLAGKVGETCASASLCAMRLDNVIPVGRLQAWMSAFRYVNQDVCIKVSALGHHRLDWT